jgi:Na+-transporting NADH:ubiquinone oxidoreductase subunit F
MAVSIAKRDYSLVGENTILALQRGLAEATWYTSPVPKEKMRELLERRDGPALRDTILWFAILIGAGLSAYALWKAGSWWAVLPFMIYGVVYASSSDSRWHEAGHGTAFKTDWMNNALYEIASFMVMRESVPWRWSHVRHHSDTIIIGRDPEIAVPRPPDILRFVFGFFSLRTIRVYFHHLVLHSTGRLTAEEKTYVPKSEYEKTFIRARISLLIYATVIGLAIYQRTLLPLMFVGLPQLYGAWLTPIYAYPQHAGLAENVLDHRLNCRTLYMNPVHRFLYWNMNYHVEHHMFPLVPYHNLPRLHELVKADMPAPYPSLFAAWRELVPAVLRQVKDPSYYVERRLPTPTLIPDAPTGPRIFTAKGRAVNGWVEVCVSGFLKPEDVIRFDHEGKTYAIYRTAEGGLFATDGLCTHGRAHLAEGFVKGNLIECPKHNGRFDFTDGSPQRKPACVALQTFEAQEHDGKIFLRLATVGKHCKSLAQHWPIRSAASGNRITFPFP